LEPSRFTVEFHRSGFNSPSERTIVDATVDFLNGATIRIDGQESSETDQTMSRSEGSLETLETLFDSIRRNSKSFPNAALLESEAAGNSIGVGNDEMRYRAVLRGLFCAFAQDPMVTRNHFLEHEFTWHLNGDAWFRPATGIFHTYQLNSYQNVVTVGSCLLLDPKEELGQKLCQCHLCRTFFWEIPVPRGRPRRRYCGPAHLEESHNVNAANRTKLSRERKKKREEEMERVRKLRRKSK
jgi:hypothetical protein